MKVGIMSNRDAPDGLGYTYGTKVFTTSGYNLQYSKTEKKPKFKLQSETWLHEVGIASNRLSL